MVVGVKLRCFGVRLEKRKVFGPDILEKVKKQVCMVRENL
jgi:hypothetical protein